ncbi:MAG: hypothetical protein Q8L55_09015 [Phycisphaerales bacterium]|nr:hypothetical protein [Phycisphaerales bacterium]
MFPKLPLRLHAEPRLWGLVVLHDRRNPPEWQGKRLPFDGIAAIGGGVPGWPLLDATGARVQSGGRTVNVTLAHGTQGTFRRARKRLFKRRLAAGDLDTVVRHPPRKVDLIGLTVISAIMAALGITGLWMMLAEHFATDPSRLEWYDLPLKSVMVAMPLLLGAPFLWWMRRIARRSCTAYRLTATSVTPLDGPWAGRQFDRSSIVRHQSFAQSVVRLWFPEQMLQIEWPPVPFSVWMDSEEADRASRRRSYIRCAWYGGVALVCAITLTLVLPRPERDPNALSAWQVAALLLGMGLFHVWLFKYGPPWLAAKAKQSERKKRQLMREKSASSEIAA